MVKATYELKLKTSSEVKFDNVCVLVTDDKVVNQMILSENLKLFGCKVSIAANSFEAVTQIIEKKFDLVFMDCEMPVMDGFLATVEIRKLEVANKLEHQIIIAFTASASQQDQNKCTAAGMDDYLT